MLDPALNISRYLKYILHAVDEHSLQAPFIYDFYANIVKGPAIKDRQITEIELLRQKLLLSKDFLSIKDLGAGSRINPSQYRKVGEIAKNSLSKKKFSDFLYRLIKTYNFNHIVELGTSFGINTLYMASANPQGEVTSFEGCSATAQVARNNFTALHCNNIRLIEGDINEKLPEYIQEGAADLVYFDANHTYKATLQYFNYFVAGAKSDALFVFDDIHWSSEMEKAWETIQSHPRVTLSVDLFDAGIVFFRERLEKNRYILAF